MSRAGLEARIPVVPEEPLVRERIFTIRVGGTTVVTTFRSPLSLFEQFEREEDFAARLSLAIDEGAPDPFARARALRGQVREVD